LLDTVVFLRKVFGLSVGQGSANIDGSEFIAANALAPGARPWPAGVSK